MNRDDCFYLGFILKPHNREGTLVLKLDVDVPEEYKELESVFVEIDKQLVPFFVEWMEVDRTGRCIAKFEGVDDKASAEELAGKELLLPLELLPELNGNDFYYHEVSGFEVIDTQQGSIGELKDILELNHQDLFRVLKGDREILIPVSREILKKVDREKRQLVVTAPEGLIELYLG